MRKNHRNFRAFPAPDTNTDTGRLYGATSPDRPEREAAAAGALRTPAAAAFSDPAKG